MTVKRAGPFLSAWRWLLAASGLTGMTLGAWASGPGPAEFGVRTLVVDPSGGRLYAMLSMQMYSSDPNNLPPVDEESLMMYVSHELDAHGYRAVAKGQTPEILITVHYGRAWLRNPYLTDKADNLATDGISSIAGIDRLPNGRDINRQNVVGSTTQFMDRMSPGYEAKIQKAAAEKLYIRVTGWKYPADSKAKARMLWQTTVIVDDPDRWNLNAVAGGMLAAGAPYFNREIAEREIEVHPPVPEGHVNVGAVSVVEPPAPKAAPGVPLPATANRSEAAPPKKFNVPAGNAVLTLQEFSRQSGEQIIYPIDQVRAVRTNGINGELGARAALERMLDGTGLTAVQDEKTGALAVKLESRTVSPAAGDKVIRD